MEAVEKLASKKKWKRREEKRLSSMYVVGKRRRVKAKQKTDYRGLLLTPSGSFKLRKTFFSPSKQALCSAVAQEGMQPQPDSNAFAARVCFTSGTKELLPRGLQADRKCPVSFAVGKILDSK